MGERLSFASYVNCLKKKLQRPYNQDLEITRLLLEFLKLEGTDYEAHDRNGNGIIVNKTMASNLLNNKENVHRSLQDNCDSDIVISGVEEFFTNEILEIISPHLQDDLMEDIVKIVNADTSISESKKKEFLQKKEENNISGFLSSVFLYAVKKENKIEKQMKNSKEDGLWDTNKQYYNSFVENLFLHRWEENKTVRLKDLFIIPMYEEIRRYEHSGKMVNVLKYISEFSMHIVSGERYQGEVLFIEGDAGVGKTSLVSYLSYLYKAKEKEWKCLFQDKTLLCIRLRDIIPKGMKFSSDKIVMDILKYLKLHSMDELKKLYKNPLIILDGFDELCMVEGISANSENYIYQISKAFADYKVIITTRPQYLDVERLDVRKKHIILQHFDSSQRQEWVERYEKTGILEYEKTGIEYILNEKNEEIDSICDTPMVMYMIVAGGISEEAKHNKWLLYHQIFYKELSDTEYNSMFPNCEGIFSHDIGKYRDQLYRLSSEIAYKMFCSGNTKLFLISNEILDIVDKLMIKDIKLKEIVQHCYALCNYWKSNDKGAVEFYHNNIRDFFLCEKIYYEFNIMYQKCELLGVQEMVTFITEKIYDLFRFMQFPEKVLEFLYLRAKYYYEHDNRMDFPSGEYERKYLSHFFSDMLQYGGISYYDRNSGENVYDNMINVLANTVRIFRYILEPYMIEGECVKWYNDAYHINKANILEINFRKIFISLKICDNDSMISLFSKSNFSGLNLREVNLEGASLRGVNLERANLYRANLYRVNLEGASLREVKLEGTNLKGANLEGVNLEGANLLGANLEGAKLKGANLEGANLFGVNLEGVNLRGANLEGASLRGANLERTNLENAKLEGANLEGAKLKGASLEGANLKGAVLITAKLEEANLKEANLEGANLFGANLTGAKLKGASLEGADLTVTVLPDEFCEH